MNELNFPFLNNYYKDFFNHKIDIIDILNNYKEYDWIKSFNNITTINGDIVILKIEEDIKKLERSFKINKIIHK